MTQRPPLIPRLVAERVVDALEDEPVALLHGPRQAGKTTLARLAQHAEGRLGRFLAG